MWIKGKKILIFGFGKEGVAGANYLGYDNKITIIDEKNKEQIDKTFFQKLIFLPEIIYSS